MNPRHIALFGGSFDPVHLGHIHIAEAAVKGLALDLVVFIPCQQSPHKARSTIANESDRIAMLHLATAKLPWAEISEIETLLPPPADAWITAETMREIFPNARLFWLMGEDQWKVIESWNHSQLLAAQVEFIVHTRGGSPTKKPGFRAHFIDGDHPATASEIRRQAPSRLVSEWLHPNVERHIRSRSLYMNAGIDLPAPDE